MNKALEIGFADTEVGHEVMHFLTSLCQRRSLTNPRVMRILAQMVGIFAARLGIDPGIASNIMQAAYLEESRDLNKVS